MTVTEEIVAKMMTTKFTNEELNQIAEAFKFARANLTTRMKWSLRTGDKVKFTNSRNGQIITGTVANIARKYVTVNTSTTSWRVPANMLEQA